VSKVVSAIGRSAGIVVDRKATSDPDSPRVKYASAHDLRRSFGARWAVRVMPQVLMELMRHEKIETTLKYYVGKNAEATADAVYEAFEKSNISGNTALKSERIQRES
jgi:integrase